MNESDKKSFDKGGNSGEEVGLGTLISRLAFRTVLIFLVFFSLLALLVGILFPGTYMKMYASVGAYGKAADYAAQAADREACAHTADCDGSCEYGSLLLNGLGYADQADRVRLVYRFANDYLETNCHAVRSARRDAAAVKEYAKTDVASLAIVYGTDDYVAGERFEAMLRLGGEVSEESTFRARAEAELTAAVQSADPAAGASVLRMLASCFSLEASPMSAAMTGASDVYESFAAYADGLAAEDARGTAEKASLLYRLFVLADCAEERGADGFDEARTHEAQTAFSAFVLSKSKN